MDLYEKNGNSIYILNVLKKYSNEDHKMSAVDIKRKVKEIYKVDIDERTIKRNINLLKYKPELAYDISTRVENGQGYYINSDPDTDFEPGEIRAIIDTFNYADYIVPNIAKDIIKKCKNLQNVYENAKLKNYQIYSKNAKTSNAEVLKNIEDIVDNICNKTKITFEYWKYEFSDNNYFKVKEKNVSTPKVSPYALIYDRQEFYLIALKDGEDILYRYRLDRIKNVKSTDEIVIEKSKKEIKEFAETSVLQFGGRTEEIEAIVSTSLIGAVYDNFGKNVEVQRIDDEHFKLTLEADVLGFRMWAMRNIDLVTIKNQRV